MATYYYDFNRGDDSNDGLTPETAWKNLTKIATVASAGGDKHLLVNDSVWEYDFNTRVVIPVSWTGTESNPVIIDSYIYPNTSSNQKPTIKWRKIIQANEWTYSAPDNAWVYTSPVNIGNLVLVRLNKTWVASRVDGTQLPLASIDGRYSNNGTSFYLYAPASMNPSEYYKEVLIGSSDSSFFSVSTGRGWVKFKNIHLEESGSGFLLYNNSSTPNGIYVENCSANFCSIFARAMGDSATAAATFICFNNTITNWGSACIAAYTPSGSTMTTIKIYDNTITTGMNNYSQGAIYIQANCIRKGQIFGNKIRDVNYGTVGKTADGSAIYAEIRANNLDIFSNYISDCHVAMQDNSGAFIRWYGNVIVNCKTAMKCTDESANNQMQHEFYNNTCIVGANILQKEGAGETGTGHRIFKESGTILSVKVKNNIFYNAGSERFLGAVLTATVTPSVSDYSYNLAYNYDNVAIRQYSLVVESSPNSILNIDPQLTPFNYLTSSSPAKYTGVKLENIKTYLQNNFDTPPSIGAYEYIRPRTAASTRTMRT